MKTNKEALASHLGMNISDLTDYNYQPERFTKTVYGLSDAYWCASKNSILPLPISKNTDKFNWVEVVSYVNRYGYRVYKSDVKSF